MLATALSGRANGLHLGPPRMLQKSGRKWELLTWCSGRKVEVVDTTSTPEPRGEPKGSRYTRPKMRQSPAPVLTGAGDFLAG